MFLSTCVALLYAFTAQAEHTTSEIVLITSLYNETNSERACEYIECLRSNLTHPLISKIHVFYDTSNDHKTLDSRIYNFITIHPKITIDYCTTRPSFGALFNCANSKYREKTIIVSNADIYFNDTLHLIAPIDFSKKVFALGRWNVTKNGTLELAMEDFCVGDEVWHQPSACSQDSWIFKSPLTIHADDIILGTPHCDHYLAYRLAMSGYEVYNPSKSVQCCHLHLSNIRNYTTDNEHSKPSAAVIACALSDIGNAHFRPKKLTFG